jgi:hypothetical protein
MEDRLSCGVELHCVPDIVEALNSNCRQRNAENFDFLVCPLVHPRYQRPFDHPKVRRQEPWTRSDLLLPSNDWGNFVIGRISRWLNLDSPSPKVRSRSEKVPFPFKNPC